LRKLNAPAQVKQNSHFGNRDRFGIEPLILVCSDNPIAASRHGIGVNSINAYLIEQLMRASHF
jgi:hypothetical protein